jgi:alkylation response protein AidB-like acyl-CoA dehydrogenase
VEGPAYLAFRRNLFATLWRDVAPLADDIEDHEQIPFDVVWPLFKAMDAFGLFVPEEFGGKGLTATQYLPIISEISKVHGGIRAVLHVHNSFAHAVADHGTHEQRHHLLPGAARGDISIAFALTEPDHGTGRDTGTRARLDGDTYIIDGTKWLITNSNLASHFLVVARTGDDPGALSTIIVERGAPGLEIKPLPETMGCKGGEHGVLTFRGVKVPADRVLGGQEGHGEQQIEAALEISRLLVAASSLGTAEYALALSIERSRQRVTFGRPIAHRQAVQRYLAEMATDVYALRTMLADAAAKYDDGQRIPAEASMAKLFGLEAVGRVTDRALLVFGGIGYTRRHPIERLYRDARLNWLEEGTPTIMYLSTARELLNGYSWGELSRSMSDPRAPRASSRNIPSTSPGPNPG